MSQNKMLHYKSVCKTRDKSFTTLRWQSGQCTLQQPGTVQHDASHTSHTFICLSKHSYKHRSSNSFLITQNNENPTVHSGAVGHTTLLLCFADRAQHNEFKLCRSSFPFVPPLECIQQSRLLFKQLNRLYTINCHILQDKYICSPTRYTKCFKE